MLIISHRTTDEYQHFWLPEPAAQLLCHHFYRSGEHL